MYKPPDSSKYRVTDYKNYLLNHLTKVDAENTECIGNLNYNYLKKNHHTVIKQLFTTYGFKLLILNSTRVTNNSATLIDVIHSTHPSNITMSCVIQADISDHDMIGCVRKLNNVKFKSKVITCRNYKSYNPDIINEELRCTNWNVVYSSFCPSKAWDKMKSILLTSLDKHAPWIIIKRFKGKTCPWLDSDVKREMNHRDQLLRKSRKSGNEFDWLSYKRKRNFVNNLIKRTKKEYYEKLLTVNSFKPYKLWKAIKEAFPVTTVRNL